MSAENSKGEAEQSAQDNPAPPIQESTGTKTPPTGEEQNNSPVLRILKDPQWWQAFAAAVLVPVGAYALWIYGSQLDEMRKATRAATEALKFTRENSHIDQRAWVAPINTDGKPEIGKYYEIRVTVRNTGKTFARRLKGVVIPRFKE